jgi:hypothetical protein
MWGVKIWEFYFLATGLLAEHIGLSEVHALPSVTLREDYPRIIKIRAGLAGKT